MSIVYLNRPNTIKIAMTAIASANKNAVIMASNMRGDAEGFLPTAFTAACPIIPITTDGPKVLKSIIITTVRFRIARLPP